MEVKQWLLPLCIAAALATGCDSGSSTDYDFTPEPTLPSEPDTTTQGPIFDPSNGLLPTTNDLLFAGSVDGTLNIPNAGANPLLDMVNKLDGFSTSSPLTASFGAPIQTTSLSIGENVRVFEVTKDASGLITVVGDELGASDLYVTTTAANSDTLVIQPLKPLKENTSYMVVLTTGIQVLAGTPEAAQGAAPSATYKLAKATVDYPSDSALAALNGLRAIASNTEAMAKSKDEALVSDNIALSWSFTTQSVSNTLKLLQSTVEAGEIGDVTPMGSSPRGAANLAVTTLDIPYYLEKPTTDNPTAAVTGYWKGVDGSDLTRFNPSPVLNETLTIPVVVSIPAVGEMPASGWPVVIYQHGITRNRTDVLAVADSLAAVGFAVVSIDLPLHGITEQSPESIQPFKSDNEFTFGIDYVTQDEDGNVTAQGADGVEDSSGSSFLNLSNLLASRDNIRQGALNLMVLRKTLEASPSLNGVAIDGSRVGFVGHSLGGMVGSVFLGAETMPTVSSIVAAGGGIPRLLDASASYGDTVRGGLAAQGVTGADYQSFLTVAQWILDAADPINYAQTAADTHPIHMIEMIGDTVVPNSAGLTGPLSGTEPLAALMGLQSVSQTATDGAFGIDGIVRFTEGTHGSILDPSVSLAATTEIQSQIAAYQLTFGTVINVANPAVVKQPDL